MLDEERIWSMHCRGKTAGEIDTAMKLEPGTARRVISEKWADAAFSEHEEDGRVVWRKRS